MAFLQSGAQAARSDGPERIAGRFRVLGVLGRGAMGEVLSVLDEPTGRALALKRLSRPESDRLAAAMFEREYRTLAALHHPCIIEVFEYGRTREGPYYTMEVLGGGDLRELAPLPYAQACRYLRDVASSLALLHARRLLHRDLSPRNVRVTESGRAKLIDFGALCTFGVAGEVVGTPPFIAPEAIRGLPLDQRTDLYALGALAYFLLTGRHAYPARELDELEGLYRTPPPPPSAVLAQRAGKGEGSSYLPAALDALVMALLDLDPAARPASAPEVIDKLSVIGALDAEPLPEVARGYLAFGHLVGRELELAKIRSVVEAATAGRGGGVLVLGGAGVGRSRLLRELSLSAQVAGMVVVQVRASEVSGAYGVVRELIAKLMLAMPEAVLEAARPHAEILGRFSEPLRERLGVSLASNPMAGMPGGWRKRTQLALCELFLTLGHGHGHGHGHARRLVLVVDDLEHADDASASLLTRLSRDGIDRGLLVAAALRSDALREGPVFLRAFETSAELLRPTPLSAAGTEQLVSSLFGDAPNVKRLAHVLHDRSSGLPQVIVELSEALVQAGVVRELQGLWVIPDHVEDIDARLGDDVDAAAAMRLSSLGAEARSLAELACLRRAPLSLSLWVALAEEDGHADPLTALAELTSTGVLVLGAGELRFAHESLRAYLERSLDAARRLRLHLSLGRRLLDQGDADVNRRIEAGFHLLRGGDEARGADLLAAAGLELVYDVDEMPAAASALEAALEVYRRQRRSLRELCRLLGPLAVAGYHTDLRLAQIYGDEAIALQERLLGLALARRLRPLLGRRLSLYAGLTFGVLRFVLGSGARGVAEYLDAMSLFVISSTALGGAAAICLDSATAARRAEAIEPLAALGHEHVGGVAYRFAQGLVWVTEERQAAATATMRELVEVLERGKVEGLTPSARLLLLGGARYALGAIEGFRDGAHALRYAAALEGMGSRLYDMVADQVRANFHATRGEAALADLHRQRVEMHAIDTGSGWQAEVWAPCSTINAALLTHDVLALKRATGQLEQLAAHIPSLRLFARLARECYSALRGDASAIDAFEAFFRAEPPRSFIGWSSMASVIVAARNERGEHAQARQLGSWALAQLQPEDLTYVAFSLKLEVHHAMARAGLGDLTGAALELDALLERCAPGNGPISLGLLHEYRARLWLLQGERERAQEQLERMSRHYRSTGHPALCARSERVRRELRMPAAPASAPPAPFGPASEVRLTRATFYDCLGEDARAQRVLDVLLARTDAESGFLFALDGATPRLLAPLHGEEPSAELLQWLSAELVGPTRSELPTQVLATGSRSAVPTLRRAICLLEHNGARVACAVLQPRARAPVASLPDELGRLLAEVLVGAPEAYFATSMSVTARRV